MVGDKIHCWFWKKKYTETALSVLSMDLWPNTSSAGPKPKDSCFALWMAKKKRHNIVPVLPCVMRVLTQH